MLGLTLAASTALHLSDGDRHVLIRARPIPGGTTREDRVLLVALLGPLPIGSGLLWVDDRPGVIECDHLVPATDDEARDFGDWAERTTGAGPATPFAVAGLSRTESYAAKFPGLDYWRIVPNLARPSKGAGEVKMLLDCPARVSIDRVEGLAPLAVRLPMAAGVVA